MAPPANPAPDGEAPRPPLHRLVWVVDKGGGARLGEAVSLGRAGMEGRCMRLGWPLRRDRYWPAGTRVHQLGVHQPGVHQLRPVLNPCRTLCRHHAELACSSEWPFCKLYELAWTKMEQEATRMKSSMWRDSGPPPAGAQLPQGHTGAMATYSEGRSGPAETEQAALLSAVRGAA